MRTNLSYTWAWVVLAAVATTGCSSSKPFAKMPPNMPQMPPNANAMNPPLNNNNGNALAKSGWNQPPGPNANRLAIPQQGMGNNTAAPVIPANAAGGMNSNMMNPNQPPQMPAGLTTPPPGMNTIPSAINVNAPSTGPAPVQPANYQMPPQPVAPLNQSNASPNTGRAALSGQRLPESVAKNSLPIPASVPEPVSTSNMLPQPVPPAMDVPAAVPQMPTMTPMPKPAGLPAPQNLVPPAQLPPVSNVPPAPTPLPVRARPQE